MFQVSRDFVTDSELNNPYEHWAVCASEAASNGLVMGLPGLRLALGLLHAHIVRASLTLPDDRPSRFQYDDLYVLLYPMYKIVLVLAHDETPKTALVWRLDQPDTTH